MFGSQQEMINVCARCSLWHRSQITKGIPQDMDNWEFFWCHVTFRVILKLSGTTQFDRTMPQWWFPGQKFIFSDFSAVLGLSAWWPTVRATHVGTWARLCAVEWATWAAASLALGRCTKCAAGGGPAIFRWNPRAFSAGTSLANGSDVWGIIYRVFKNYIFVLICSHLTLVIMHIVTYILYIYIYFIYTCAHTHYIEKL